MNEAKPTSGWNEAKPSFPPDDLSAPVSPGGGHLVARLRGAGAAQKQHTFCDKTCPLFLTKPRYT